jgi:hypothetical protein
MAAKHSGAGPALARHHPEAVLVQVMLCEIRISHWQKTHSITGDMPFNAKASNIVIHGGSFTDVQGNVNNYYSSETGECVRFI